MLGRLRLRHLRKFLLDRHRGGGEHRVECAVKAANSKTAVPGTVKAM
jgi:hypothetical protein